MAGKREGRVAVIAGGANERTLELAESGVRVNCICPAAIATPRLAGALGATEEAPQTVRSVVAPAQPIRRAGPPEHLANAVLWRASDAASFVTGHALVVDGGLTAGLPWWQPLPQMRSFQPLQG